ncbi:MAG: hypothetical protein IPK19_09690 [Chloroflexi bacterium]|nr:hypothetical protein [Chloroflexota bacterium]
MLRSFGRFISAFRRALQLAARGETPRQAALRAQNPELADWCKHISRQANDLLAAARRAGVDAESVNIRIDGRARTMRFIVAALLFHVQQEYPHLMTSGDPHRWLTFHATHLNDRYAVSKLREALPASLDSAAQRLSELLEHPPAQPG